MSKKIEWGAGTPGPWHRNRHFNGTTVSPTGPDWREQSAIAVCVSAGTRNLEEAKANARAVAEVPAMVQALRAARQFITNGIEFGYIQMPDPATPDSAHDTLPMIEAVLRNIDGEG
jgi:hypothetical protein